MLDENDLAQIKQIVNGVHSDIEHEEVKMRVHWPRRIIILGATLGVAVIIHYGIEEAGARSFAQSAELGISALMDSIFARVRDIA